MVIKTVGCWRGVQREGATCRGWESVFLDAMLKHEVLCEVIFKMLVVYWTDKRKCQKPMLFTNCRQED